ncbi:hypothetical protein GCM10009576_097890 [Streptomyces rhizosphaericus]|uniref:Uncharacterized protein n=1 Tax=Streptomyces rhizosphaericus TaxID=114699 RepID=A0ABP4DBG1_9ACTN
MTERGLSTPAVEQIVRSRSTRRVSRWAVGKVRKVPDAHARAQVLLRKLADARRVESVLVVTRVCRDIADLTGVEGEIQAQLAAAVSDAERWLEVQTEVRRELFSHLEEAVTALNATHVHQLLVRMNATASHDRTEAENAIAEAAVECLDAFAEQRQAEAAAKRAEQEDNRSKRAADRAQTLLATLQHRGTDQPLGTMRKLVKEPVHAATEAGDRIDSHQQKQSTAWKTRADIGRPLAQTARPTSEPAQPVARSKRKPPSHEQVARRHWIKRSCPRCHAVAGKDCVKGRGGDENSEGHDDNHSQQLVVAAAGLGPARQPDVDDDRQQEGYVDRQHHAASPPPETTSQPSDVARNPCRGQLS